MKKLKTWFVLADLVYVFISVVTILWSTCFYQVFQGYHTCEHLEIRTLPSLLYSLNPPPPLPPPPTPTPTDQSFQSNHAGSLDAKPVEEEDRSRLIMHCTPHRNPQAIHTYSSDRYGRFILNWQKKK